MKKKSDLIQNLQTTLLKIYVEHKVTIKILRMDNAGENLKIQEFLYNHPILHKMRTKIEFTAPFTPQQNGKIEKVFPNLFARVRASYNAAQLSTDLRTLLWAEAINYAFQTDDITVTRGRTLGPPHRVFCNQDPSYVKHLRAFGEVRICKDGQYRSRTESRGINKHLLDRGKLGIFVGYLPNHPPGTWKFFDPNTRNFFKSRDVTWLDKSYGRYLHTINAPNLPITVPDSDEDLDEEISLGSLSTRDPIKSTDNVVHLTPTGF